MSTVITCSHFVWSLSFSSISMHLKMTVWVNVLVKDPCPAYLSPLTICLLKVWLFSFSLWIENWILKHEHYLATDSSEGSAYLLIVRDVIFLSLLHGLHTSFSLTWLSRDASLMGLIVLNLLSASPVITEKSTP